MFNTSIIEINKPALEKNLKFLRNHVGKEVKISSVVKSNAYGHGIEEFVPIAEECGIEHFATFSTDEAFRVFNVKQPGTELMIMGWLDNDGLEWAIENDLEFYVFDLERLTKALRFASAMKKKAKIHIEIETGMNRTGFKYQDLKKLVNIINDNREHFRVMGLCTHFAGAEAISNHVRVQRQIGRFRKISKWFSGKCVEPEMFHTASSAATINYPKTHLDMVRIGILQYGFWPSTETFIHYIHRRKDKSDPLDRVITWKSKVMSIKTVEQGEFISYGTTYLATEKKKIAIVPTGYSDGYSRSLSNQGRVLIRGQRVGVIGMVNMNMLIADVTYLPDIRLGDEVVLIGRQGESEISVAAFGEFSSQMNYELLARLPEDINRKIIQ